MITTLDLIAPATDEQPELRLSVRLVHSFERDNMLTPTDAPTLRNAAHAIFNRYPAALRVLLTRNGYTLLLVIETAEGYFDVSGRRLEIRSRRAAA